MTTANNQDNIGGFIRLIDEKDEIPYRQLDPTTGKFSETVFFLKTLDDKRKAEIQKKHTRRVADRNGARDETDWNAYVRDCLAEGIVRWEALKNLAGDELAYTEELKAKVVVKLPESVKVGMMRVIAGREIDEQLLQASAKN